MQQAQITVAYCILWCASGCVELYYVSVDSGADAQGRVYVLLYLCLCLCVSLCVCSDEPTSGLDSVTALGLITTLKGLAAGSPSRHPCTIITTIHQPQSKIFHLFDQLFLLQAGSVVSVCGNGSSSAKQPQHARTHTPGVWQTHSPCNLWTVSSCLDSEERQLTTLQ